MYKVITKDKEEVTVSVCTLCTLNWENQSFAIQFLESPGKKEPQLRKMPQSCCPLASLLGCCFDL